MARIEFYEKPGCVNNTRQKQLLSEAGHEVVAHDLLQEPWTAERLQRFFAGLPVADWFNRSAPQITRGGLKPEAFDAASALASMLETPLLIRRPLMQVGDDYRVGFEAESVDAWIGLKGRHPESLEACPRKSGHSCDDDTRGQGDATG